jgi:hypothetical protein
VSKGDLQNNGQLLWWLLLVRAML